MSATMTSLGSGGVALLVLAILSWLPQAVILSNIAGEEVHGDAVLGQGLAWLAAMILAFFTWLWLGGLLLKAGVEDRMPASANLPATFLYIVSVAAVAAAFFLMESSSRAWPALTPGLLPPVIIIYVFALYHP